MSQSMSFWAYLKERYSPWQFVFLSVFINVGISSVTNTAGVAVFLAAGALLLFLFRLRLFDELKDLAHDRRHHPERPVARGVVTLFRIRRWIIIVTLIELCLAFFSHAWFWWLIAYGYSVLLRYEWFVPQWLRQHFSLYTLVHELLLFPLITYVYMIQGVAHPLLNWSYITSIVWAAGPIFLLEITRKMRARSDEGTGQDTYTSQYGIRGASILYAAILMVTAIAGVLVLGWARSTWIIIGIWISLPMVVLFSFVPSRSHIRWLWAATVCSFVVMTGGSWAATFWHS